ncbi:MAG: OB-fold nucleic acid binding domain-containing protein [Candidatus Fimimorpha sp.]
MQIVRELGGYTLGRSDLVRRAMSKKKAAVMEKERKNFVYGNEEEGVPGCINNGIDEKTANHIYDEMIDFARYAFNKSHAAAYAIVAYETAYLKYYYPVEFMAALMTSVIDNPTKVAEYILTSRRMGIHILPPDVNEGQRDFSVSNGKIRYALSAIKSIGRSVIDSLVEEREKNGLFMSIKDFVNRMLGKELNKRTVENLIKSGAMDSLDGTRRQKIEVFASIMDQATRDKKQSIEGQLSLFDFVEEEQKEAFEVHFPNIPEFDRQVMLAFEKEVLGIYISGHPLEDDEELLKKNVTAVTSDFIVEEENGQTKVRDGSRATIGGMITGKTVKITKTNQIMAFVTLEDLVGTVEVLVFPKSYEKYKVYLEEDKKVFIQGRVSSSDEAQGKLICENVIPFESIQKELWIQFLDLYEYRQKEEQLFQLLDPLDGNDSVCIYLKSSRQYKKLPPSRNICATQQIVKNLKEKFGEKNVKLVEKPIENV